MNKEIIQEVRDQICQTHTHQTVNRLAANSPVAFGPDTLSGRGVAPRLAAMAKSVFRDARVNDSRGRGDRGRVSPGPLMVRPPASQRPAWLSPWPGPWWA